MLLKFHTQNRTYSDYIIYDVKDLVSKEIQINPLESKLLNNDIFSIVDEQCVLNSSALRKNNYIPGVLCLHENKTYGRYKKKLLYKCIPDDCRIPIFLIPYECKAEKNFSKVKNNLYVTFEFKNWDGKHPIGTLTQNLGEVSLLKNFYEYQLYCKSLHHSIQILNTKTLKMIEIKKQSTNDFILDMCKSYNINSVRYCNKWNIFSIDPENSLDFDDAFSIKMLNNGCKLLSIYISYVPIWIDYLGLWDSFSKRISTIYLPDKKRPMLPTILSDNLCSLTENNKRFAMCLDITLDDKNKIIKNEFSIEVIEVTKNFRYEQDNLLLNEDYFLIKEIISSFKENKTFNFIKKTEDSHDIVCNLMLIFNYYSASNLLSFGNGIFRTTQSKDNPVTLPEECPANLTTFLQFWHNTTGSYQKIADLNDLESLSHKLLNMNQYVHMSSPIRRLVDLLNMIQFTKNHNFTSFSEKGLSFYNNWLKDLEYINVSTRSIRKLQSDCQLLYMVESNPDLLGKTFQGFCLDKLHRNDGLFQYVIYLPELKLTSRMIIKEELQNFQENQYSLYIFKNENNLKKKIRIQII